MQVLFKNNRGMVLVVLIMMMVILLSITGASLLFSRLNLKKAASYKTGGAVFQIADAGIQHALAVIPSTGDFDALLQGDVSAFPCGTPCDGSSNKPTLTGSLAGSTYSVVVMDDDDGGSGNRYIDDTNKIVVLISTAKGPNKSERSVLAYIKISPSSIPPGAVYAPGSDNTDPDFDPSGNNFFITGDDTNYTDSDSDGYADSMSAGPNSSVIGIAVGTQTLVNGFLNELNADSRPLVQGEGYDAYTIPETSSVAIPGSSLDVIQLANDFLNQVDPSAGCPPRCLDGLRWRTEDCPSIGSCTLGTDSAPQITYIREGSEHVHFGGYITGSGVLIIEGKGHLRGNFEFHGLVISLAPGALSSGNVEEDLKLQLRDNARIFGSILLGPNQDDLKFDIKDYAAVRYSSQALALAANNFGLNMGNGSPTLLAWHEVMK